MKKVSDLGIQVNHEGDYILQSKICSLAYFLSKDSSCVNISEGLANFIFSYLNQLKFTIEAYDKISSLINQVNAYSDQLSANSTSGIGLSPYEIESLKLQDDPQIAHYGYIFLISAKTSFDMLICLTDLIMNKTIRKEKGIDLPDFNIFYSVMKKPTKKYLFFCKRKKKYNECGKVDLLKPVFQKTYGNSHVKKIFDIRNMLIHKGYLCKVVFYGKKSMGHKIFIEQGFNVPNPKKEEIKIEELAKAYFKAISDMDSQISVILQNNFDYLSNVPSSISEVSFNGSFVHYELI